MLRVSLLLLLSLSACSLASPDDVEVERSPEADGVIVNRTSADFIPMAMDVEMAAMLDPLPEFEVRDRTPVVEAGEARALGIAGYERGENFVVFIYRVRGTTATFTSVLQVDGSDFEADDAVLTVRRF